ncbi:hypothetical protein ACWGKQ_01190 [Streptomyces sp. NPDC054770]
MDELLSLDGLLVLGAPEVRAVNAGSDEDGRHVRCGAVLGRPKPVSCGVPAAIPLGSFGMLERSHRL